MLGREFVYLDLKRAGLIGHESDGDRYPGSKVLDETEETDGIAGPRCAGGRRSEEEMRSEAEKETLRAQAKRDLSQLVAANLAAWCARLDIQMPVWDRDKAYAVVRDTGDSELTSSSGLRAFRSRRRRDRTAGSRCTIAAAGASTWFGNYIIDQNTPTTSDPTT